MACEGVAAEEGVADAIKAVLNGRADDYEKIVRQFQNSIMTVAMMLMRNREAAEELTQDVFVRAYRSLSTFDCSRTMKPWLVTIAYRLAQDAGRQRAVQTRREHLARQRAQETAPGPGPLERLIADERARSLWQSLETLPMGERTAAVLYYREGLGVEQVAEAMEVSAGTVKTLLFRARDHLRGALHARSGGVT